MIKNIFPSFLLLLWTSSLLANTHIPHSDGKTIPNLNFRYFTKAYNLNWLVGLERDCGLKIPTTALLAGFKYRLSSAHKVGLYLKTQTAVRHDNNWVIQNNAWVWNEQANSLETLYIPEYLYRFLFLDNWRGEVRVQYEFNPSQDHQTAKLRPGATYFWFKNGAPFINIYFHLERYIPINFGNKALSEQWLYIGFLRHATKNHKWGMNIKTGSWIWTPSQEFQSVFPNETYEINQSSTFIGLTYIYSN